MLGTVLSKLPYFAIIIYHVFVNRKDKKYNKDFSLQKNETRRKMKKRKSFAVEN